MRRLRVSVFFILALCLGGALGATFSLPAQAQVVSAADAPDYAAWQVIAADAEAALAQAATSDTELEALRAVLVRWRDRFLVAQGANQTRVDTLQGQIAALGPPPADGVVEPADLTERRAELAALLAETTAPRRAAEDAYTRTDGLIREIDTVLRLRMADELTRLGPSPLNPVHWPDAVAVLADSAGSVWGESTAAIGAERPAFRENLPLVVGLLVLAVVLIARAPRWLHRLARPVLARAKSRPRLADLAETLVSFAALMVPLLGVYAASEAMIATGFLGPRGMVLAKGLVSVGLGYFGARWLGRQLFDEDVTEGLKLRAHFLLTPPQRRIARAQTAALGLLLGLSAPLAQFLGEAEAQGDGAGAVVLYFPLTVLAGLILFRFGRLLFKTAGGVPAPDETTPAVRPVRSTLQDGVGRVAMIVGLLAPLLAAIGYASAARGMLWPMITSLALIGLLVVILRLGDDLFALLTRRDEVAMERALLPDLMAFALVALALPLFALIWGARVTDITEIWARAREGLRIGDIHVAPADLLAFLLVFGVGYLLTRVVQNALAASVLPKTRLDPGGQNAVRVGIGYLGITLAALMAISVAGLDLTSLALVAGALSVGIGFGLQTIVSNFVSGIILLIERPISEGDWIEVNGQMGYVRDISVRATRIETFDRQDVMVPNADLISGPVTNYTRGNALGRLIVPIGVARGSDTRHVERVLHAVAEAQPLVALSPEPQVLFMGFGEDRLHFELRVILPDVSLIMRVRSELNHQIAAAFVSEGIEIPGRQSEIWLHRAPTPTPDDTPPANSA